MKKILTSTLIIGLFAVACKSKKSVAKSMSNEPGETQLTALKAKVPEATMDDLKKGHNIFYGTCTTCHGAKDVTGFTEDELQKTINRMAPKAKLTESEKDAVWKYALAVNLSSKK
jgi:mono/diheme cytochrome c family protein